MAEKVKFVIEVDDNGSAASRRQLKPKSQKNLATRRKSRKANSANLEINLLE
jgi:hypothetical protein